MRKQNCVEGGTFSKLKSTWKNVLRERICVDPHADVFSFGG